MRYYRIEGVSARLEAGAVAHLTDAQAAARRHQAVPVPGRPDVYAFRAPSTFKRGEEFGCESRPVGQVLEVTTVGPAFEERILRERAAFAEWKAAELARRNPAAAEAAPLPGIRRRRAKSKAA